MPSTRALLYNECQRAIIDVKVNIQPLSSLCLKHFGRLSWLRWHTAFPIDKSSLQLGSLFVGRIGEMNGNFFAKVLRDLFQSQAGGLWEEEVDDFEVLVGCPSSTCMLVLPGMKNADQQMMTR